MNDQKNSGKAGSPAEPTPEAPRRRRRHGYRGYPNRSDGTGVHWGTGFSGVEPLGAGSGVLPKARILTESSRRDASKN
jgi:hypothetical protein